MPELVVESSRGSGLRKSGRTGCLGSPRNPSTPKPNQHFSDRSPWVLELVHIRIECRAAASGWAVRNPAVILQPSHPSRHVRNHLLLCGGPPFFAPSCIVDSEIAQTFLSRTAALSPSASPPSQSVPCCSTQPPWSSRRPWSPRFLNPSATGRGAITRMLFAPPAVPHRPQYGDSWPATRPGNFGHTFVAPSYRRGLRTALLWAESGVKKTWSNPDATIASIRRSALFISPILFAPFIESCFHCFARFARSSSPQEITSLPLPTASWLRFP